MTSLPSKYLNITVGRSNKNEGIGKNAKNGSFTIKVFAQRNILIHMLLKFFKISDVPRYVFFNKLTVNTNCGKWYYIANTPNQKRGKSSEISW